MSQGSEKPNALTAICIAASAGLTLGFLATDLASSPINPFGRYFDNQYEPPKTEAEKRWEGIVETFNDNDQGTVVSPGELKPVDSLEVEVPNIYIPYGGTGRLLPRGQDNGKPIVVPVHGCQEFHVQTGFNELKLAAIKSSNVSAKYRDDGGALKICVTGGQVEPVLVRDHSA